MIGGALGARLPLDKARLLLFAFLIGGFLGGYLFGAVLGLAPWQSVVGWAPAVILSGLAAGGAAILIQRSAHRAAAPDG